jgi:hypothetical protein
MSRTITRRAALASVAAASVVPAVALASVVDDRKARLLGALAEFDAAASAEQIAARRLNAIPAVEEHYAAHEAAMNQYEQALVRVRLADERVTAAARKIDPAATSIVTREGTYVVLPPEASFVGDRLFFPAARSIDLR